MNYTALFWCHPLHCTLVYVMWAHCVGDRAHHPELAAVARVEPPTRGAGVWLHRPVLTVLDICILQL